MMLKNIFALLILICFSVNSYGFKGNTENLIKSLKEAEDPINGVLKKVAELYEKNSGEEMRDCIACTEEIHNSAITEVVVGKNYSVGVTISGDDNLDKNNSARIVLMPVHDAGTSNITSWQCITDADENIEDILGMERITNEGYISIISLKDEMMDSPYLSNCIYLKINHLTPFYPT